jgi:hypothetical protein
VLAVAGIAAALAASPAGAGENPNPTLPWSATPTSGPPGTTVTVSGDGCSAPDLSGVARIVLGDLTALAEGGTLVLATVEISAGSDGSWTGELVVPPGVDPSHSFIIGGVCQLSLAGQEPQDAGEYDGITFDVTGDGPAPTEPTVPTEPTTPTVPGEPPAEPEVPTPPPATPIVDDPDFTG